jgi:hypothetical protein
MISHACWLDDSRILGYLQTPQNGAAYQVLEDFKEGNRPVGAGILVSDGHPCVDSSGALLVTDTYPNRTRRQELIVYDLPNSSAAVLASLRIPYAFRNEFRCDFHPRWDRSGTMISFDSAHTGVRSHCTIQFKKQWISPE